MIRKTFAFKWQPKILIKEKGCGFFPIRNIEL